MPVWRSRRCRQQPFQEEWTWALENQIPFYAQLRGADRAKLRENVHEFVCSIRWVSVGGGQVSETQKAIIAAGAARLIHGLDLNYYEHLHTVRVYPRPFASRGRSELAHGVAHQSGVVELAWTSVQWGTANPRSADNVVLHELAHMLDIADGYFDGAPELRQPHHYDAWADELGRVFHEMRGRIGDWHELIPPHAAIDEAEFFGIVTEIFFEQPRRLREYVPQIYREFERFYGQDPLRLYDA